MKEEMERFPTPKPSDSAREKARHRALVAFRQADSTPVPRPTGLWLRWALVVVAVAVLGVVLLNQGSSFDSRREGQLLAQMRELFGPALSALLEKNGEIEIQSDSGNHLPGEQPLLIEIFQGNEKSRVLGFSGRDVIVPLKDGAVRIDPLVTGDGDILLVGENFVIRNEGSENGVRFRTQRLEMAL